MNPRSSKRNIKKAAPGLITSQDDVGTSRMYLRRMACGNVTKVAVRVFGVVAALPTKEFMISVIQLQSEDLLD